MPERRKLPPGWHEPTPRMLDEYRLHFADGNGLVPADHEAHKGNRAEEVPIDEITGHQAQGVLRKMWGVVERYRSSERTLMGLAAPQVGENIRLVLVPGHRKGELMPVFNPTTDIYESYPPMLVPHGCATGHNVFTKLWSPTASRLYGYDEHGQELLSLNQTTGLYLPGIEREGMQTVVDQHEGWHLDKIRPGDVGLVLGRQLDFDPPETTEEYRAFIEDCTANPSSENWRLPFMGEQWVALNAGEFAIRHFL